MKILLGVLVFMWLFHAGMAGAGIYLKKPLSAIWEQAAFSIVYGSIAALILLLLQNQP